HPVELPRTFWIALDFRPHQTKGVYVSYDNSTGGRHSLVGLPGLPTARSRRGDWMIEAGLAEEGASLQPQVQDVHDELDRGDGQPRPDAEAVQAVAGCA